MRRCGSTVLAALAVVCAAAAARGDVKPAGIFGDHMVLQAGVKLPVWGTADPGEAISVQAAESSAKTTGGADGKWRVDLDPLTATGQPIQLLVRGKNEVKIRDVLVGDVWLASGQSNMEFSLKGALNGKEALKHATEPAIRFCIVGNKPSLEPLADRKVTWELCTPETAKKFSAVAYFFGQDIHAATGKPVGLIGSYVAGTPAQSWTSLESLQSSPELKHYVDALKKARSAAADDGDTAGISAGVPTSLYNGMIAPLVPFALKGVIWYQGESNVEQSAEYRTLFPAMITGWRKTWSREDLPFLFVQLPGFSRRAPDPGPSPWAQMREAQTSALKLPDTAMAVTIELTPARALLHPKNKADVGHRLALLARHLVYGENVTSEGPMFELSQIEGDKIRVHFSHAEGGLVVGVPPEESGNPAAIASDGTVKGFSIAGADQKFVWADAKIDGETVIVSSDQVKSPMAVRYGWAENPQVNLYNKSLLPAAPFRTDHWADSVEAPAPGQVAR